MTEARGWSGAERLGDRETASAWLSTLPPRMNFPAQA